MALTQVNSNGLKDDSIVNADVKSDADIAGSKLAADSIAEEKLDISNSASDGQYLQYKDSTDKLTWASVSTTDSTKMPLAGGTFTGDVIFDNATNAGKDLTWDMSDNALEFTDDTKAVFGAGGDLSIFHNGTDSFLDSITGSLKIRSDTGNMAVFTSDGTVELYYNEVKKLNTDSGGIEVVGAVMPSGNISMVDSAELKIGTGDDLKLYHDGSDSYIDEAGTGSLIFRASPSIEFRKAGGTEKMLYAEPDAQVELYYDNSKKLETQSDGVTVTGWMYIPDSDGSNNMIRLGNGADLQLFHQASNNVSYIQQTVSAQHLIIKNTNADATGSIYIEPKHGQSAAKFDGATGEVSLRYGGNEKFKTTSGGAQVTGNMVADAFYLGDNEKLYLGTGDDFQMWHDSSNNKTIFKENGSGSFDIRGNTIQLQDAGGNENLAVFTPDGGCVLKYDNTTKLETTSAGGTLTGTWTGAGKVLQVKRAHLGSDFNSGSTSWTDTGLSETITLASTSNWIYVILSTTPYIGGGSEERFRLDIRISASDVNETTILNDNYWAYRTSDDWKSSSGHHDVYYQPNTTNEITVNVKAVRQTGGDNLWLGRNATDANTNTLTVMEIAG